VSDYSESVERFPSGRRKTPLGIRQGGAAYERLHLELARIALQVLAERGYADLTVEEVARASGASKRTVYRHFSTKLDLAIAAINQIPTFEDVEPEGRNSHDRIRHFLEETAGYDPGFIPVLATAIVHRDSAPQLLAAVRDRVLVPRENAFERIINQGQRQGDLDPNVTAAAASALATGLLIDHWAGLHIWEDDQEGIEYAFNVIWPALRAHSPSM